MINYGSLIIALSLAVVACFYTFSGIVKSNTLTGTASKDEIRIITSGLIKSVCIVLCACIPYFAWNYFHIGYKSYFLIGMCIPNSCSGPGEVILLGLIIACCYLLSISLLSAGRRLWRAAIVFLATGIFIPFFYFATEDLLLRMLNYLSNH